MEERLVRLSLHCHPGLHSRLRQAFASPPDPPIGYAFGWLADRISPHARARPRLKSSTE